MVTLAPAQKKQMREKLPFNLPAQPGMKACVAYNHGPCSNKAQDPKDLHVCSLSLVALNRLCAQQEKLCCCKQKLPRGVGPKQICSSISVCDLDSEDEQQGHDTGYSMDYELD